MMNIQPGQRLATIYEITREVEDGEMYKGERINNQFKNKWWGCLLDLESGEPRQEILLCFDVCGTDPDKMRNQAIRLLTQNIVVLH